ncbi:hypothetical protein P6P90_12570 [Ectobacillus antri]|jgi:hypothetical protein|uniref:Uncharacterized protein n=1 Tax=Ectobacillus antri TaxID=2486280 RepID=A0ABT6H833_9BACI|nr:hypothetical protein [Ectobacillus antri]MDG4657812.1 hypothetical protein [Ectobacillus antri]MDG5754797.1 hypothetical protein [Ectobacillus antri]
MSWFMIIFWSLCIIIVGYSLWHIRKHKEQISPEKSLNQEINEANTYKDTSRNFPPSP